VYDSLWLMSTVFEFLHQLYRVDQIQIDC